MRKGILKRSQDQSFVIAFYKRKKYVEFIVGNRNVGKLETMPYTQEVVNMYVFMVIAGVRHMESSYNLNKYTHIHTHIYETMKSFLVAR